MRAAVALVLFALVLTGCGCASRTIRVEVPVPVPCVPADKVPPQPADRFSAVPATAPVDDQVRALLIDREKMGDYAPRLRALVDACAIIPATTSADRAPSP
jgi:hypothetical protein